jgi:hypothetical protein
MGKSVAKKIKMRIAGRRGFGVDKSPVVIYNIDVNSLTITVNTFGGKNE